MNDLAKDVEPLYWCGVSINSMSPTQMKQALLEAALIVLQQRERIEKLERQLDPELL